ncbi:MAG: carbamate kinase [Acidobacteria bacterium]|nr:carbamate kinase [Acidobacteriota bacterium]
MESKDRLAVVAVGGNSLIADEQHVTISDQSDTATATAHQIAEMIAAGWNLVVTHGNGPQVGFILRRSEIGMSEVPPIPMDYATSNTQGSIGYMFQRALRNDFRRRGIEREVVALITQTLVDENDPAFDAPTKPIGPHLDEATARQRAAEQGWVVKEDSGRGWRRVVPSPLSLAIIEIEVIRSLLGQGTVVIACGGGGLPVFEDENGELMRVEAVIDKDHASSLLARELGADLLLITTGVEKVAIDFGKPTQQWLDRLTLAEARRHQADGQFAPGSMGPKIQAMIDFVEETGGRGLITNPENLTRALAGETGTVILPG